MTRPSSLADLASIYDSQPISGMRNRIINGNFEIWQRGTTSRTFGVAGVYGADRWTRMGFQSGAHERVSISSPPSGLNSRFAIRVSSATTGEDVNGSRIDLSQKIENVNCYDLSNQLVTVSFWVRFSSATVTSSTATAFNNWTCFLQYNTSTTDSATSTDTGNSAPGIVTILNGSLPTTWTRYTATTTVPAGTNNISVRFQFNGLGSTASAGTVWYEITEVQLEAGPFATPFERRYFGQELMLCQRYFQRIGSTFFGATEGTTTFNLQVPFWVPMRASSTISAVSGGIFSCRYAGDTNITNPTLANITSTSENVWLQVVSSGLSSGVAIYGRSQNHPTSNFLNASAEL